MIYTVTFNPSLDYIMRLHTFQPNGVNRTYDDFIVAGGKGINVSIVLRHLGHDNTALGFIAGFTGDEIIRQVKQEGCKEAFVRLKTGTSRINVKLKSQGETEINAQGPTITEEDVATLYQQLDSLVDGDILILSGSIPKGLPNTMYRQIMERLQTRKIQIIVDATQDLLMNVLAYKPFLIKPNHHELESVFNTTFETEEDIIKAARQLQAKGARNVLVSRAGDGAILLDEHGQVRTKKVPQGTLVNSVGSGDSMVAGFLAGYLESKGDYDKALAMGVAAGSASAFQEWLANRADIEALL
ncbi:1-phosphofructokinase [Veillonella criceti]|uniref:Tagatose-6-phosphate kinase n=1 Tax=Veillonella criceti TaxID=103891 RepID=A0A380NNM2_9FIRM|nr:1-phosphofructokinase [Veillonella criceti]SUP44247.1 Tagatose-6-phosphate kinase [Veillonella criceti]